MAPGRKKGANLKDERKPFSLGDLVLAKVKGFPPWPAKVRYFSVTPNFLFFLYGF